MSIGIVNFSLATILFAVPNTIMAGGITGMATMSYYLFDLNIGVGMFLFNFPLFLAAFIWYRDLFYKSVVSMVSASILVGILQQPLIRFGVENIVIGSVIGGLWMGIGLGLMGMANSSLGGGSMLGKMINLKYGFSFGLAVFLVDSSVFPLSFFLIGAKETLFSLLLAASSAFGITLVGRIHQALIKKKLILSPDLGSNPVTKERKYMNG
ncbi:YitT family protein [Halalkalibacter flavus]|uniref:YitT family protein n=1 Tax=Halalkalibacter flavus TaxID=3090668 RepID=UPI002FC8F95F